MRFPFAEVVESNKNKNWKLISHPFVVVYTGKKLMFKEVF
jgi:hypothetical protein